MSAPRHQLNQGYLRVLFIVTAFLALGSFADAQTVTGKVTDPQGSPISGATITLRQSNTAISTAKTDERGTFTLAPNDAPNLELTVETTGFELFKRVFRNGLTDNIEITLQPAAVRADVTVSITRTETRLSETPASVVVLTREAFDSTAAQTIDDSLRQVAGFTLFRRSSSRTTNPTAQGANLRGVSGSGASRAAVLFDGLSLNDAFGGWTYWSRVPMIAVEQAEVLRGGASSLYGTAGLSGAVNLVPIRPRKTNPCSISGLRQALRTHTTAACSRRFRNRTAGASISLPKLSKPADTSRLPKTNAALPTRGQQPPQ